ncbi:MAG: extracellular solute-binding protein [Chloroflexota bacterium]
MRQPVAGSAQKSVTRRAVFAYGTVGVSALGTGALGIACAGPGADGANTPQTLQPTTIEVLHEFGPQGDNGQALQQIVERMRTLAPNLTIKSTVTSGDSWPVMLTMLAAGTPPDVSETFVANAASLGAKRIAEPLQMLLKSAKDWRPDDYFNGAREAFTYRGDFVLAPMFTAPMAVAVNQQMVNQASLKLPTATWTWDDFTSMAMRMTQRSSGETKVYGAQMPTGNGYQAMNFFGGPLWSHGGDWANRATGKLTFQEAPGIAALEMWVDVALKQQAAPTVRPEAWAGLEGSPFANGLVAMAFIASPAVRRYVRDAASFPWTTALMPRQKQQGSHFYAHGFFVLRDGKQKAGAGEFVRLVSLPQHVALWNEIAFGMPTRKSAAALKEWQDHLRANPQLGPFNDSSRFMRAYPTIAGWNEASQGAEGIGQAIWDAVQGKMAPRPALEEAARRAEAFFAEQPK